MLQWEWLGGLPPLRRAAVIGAGSWGTAVAEMLARAGLEVDLSRTGDEPAVAPAPAGVHVRAADELEFARHDLVCFAVPPAALPAAVAEYGPRIPERAGVLVRAGGSRPAARLAAGTDAWAVGVLGGNAHPAAVLHDGATLVLGAQEPAFRRQVGDALAAAGFDAVATADLASVQPAGAPRPAATVRAA
jgi:glycerol-3-phosphate dehydrogenase